MSDGDCPLVDVEPKGVVYFKAQEHSDAEVDICLTNLQDVCVWFRVKTDCYLRDRIIYDWMPIAPKSKKCFKVLIDISDYNNSTVSKVEIIVECVRATKYHEAARKWQEANPQDTMSSKVICIPWMLGELILDPRHELVFDADKPISSTVRLTNPCTYRMYFHVQASSSDLRIRPDSGILYPNETEEIMVFCKPLEWNYTDVLRDRIIIKSSVLYPTSFIKPRDTILTAKTTAIQKIDTILKPAVDVHGSASAQPSSFLSRQDIPMTQIPDEIAELCQEVRRLQLTDSWSCCRGLIGAMLAELSRLRDDVKQLKAENVKGRSE
ncbi:unnamed protein product [Dicrocoelium dendriticum]|nr:unnamed protein product [Dicrocoelium dendriticum]